MTALESPAGDLRALFDPGSVVIVGASNDQSKYGNWISTQALRMRAHRSVYLVNRSGQPVLGEPTFRALADLPGPVDLAVIAVPATGFERVVDDALAAGARAIVAITAGFAELGPEGRARQAAIAERIRAAGAVLLGPNCLGLQDSTTGLFLTSHPLPAGPVGLISQSGNLALELSRLLAARGLGCSRFASLGNQANLTAADLVRSCIGHDGTELIAVYCEDFRDGREFVAAAGDAVAAGKPVVLLAAGGSEASMRGAASHTGAMTSDSVVIDAACRAAGVDRVRSVWEMADLLSGLDVFRRAPAHRIAVLADSGGHAAVASDIAVAHGLSVSPFDPALSAALRHELTPSAGVTNPVDMAEAGEQDITSFTRTLQLLLDCPDVDAVLMTGNFGGYGDYGGVLETEEIGTAAAMVCAVLASDKPVAMHTMCADSLAAESMRQAGIPVFADVDRAARMLALLARNAERPAPVKIALPSQEQPVSDTGYSGARELLRRAGLDFPAARLARTPEEAATSAEKICFPVAVKAMGLLRKSDVGGVALNLSDSDSVLETVVEMAERLSPPGFCVERMADTTDAVELIVGVRQDARFGPVAKVGLGGVFTEVVRDVVFALAPLDAAGAGELLGTLHGKALLHGVRGGRPVDLDSLAATIALVTRVAAAHPEIAELEVNPLLATPAGCMGLDARMIVSESQ